MNDDTIGFLNDLCEEYKRRSDWAKKLEGDFEEAKKRKEESKRKILAVLNSHSLEKYHHPELGTAYIKKRFTYKVPKDDASRHAFFSFLKEKGLFESMITVHSATLNSFAKTEMEIAADSGATDFKIPGLGDPNYYETLGVRK